MTDQEIIDVFARHLGAWLETVTTAAEAADHGESPEFAERSQRIAAGFPPADLTPQQLGWLWTMVHGAVVGTVRELAAGRPLG